MRKKILWSAIFVATVAVGSGDAPAAGTDPQEGVVSFPSKVELITVDAVVLDAKGNPVSGLTRDDFQVSEDGHPKDIASFEAFALNPEAEAEAEVAAPAQPVRVVNNTAPHRKTGRAFALLVDDLRILRQETDFTRKAVASFIEKALVDGDEVTLGTTSGKAWWSTRIPEGREDLLKVLERIQGTFIDPATREHMTEYEAFWINNHEAAGGASGGATQAGALYEQTGNPADLLQRVELRYLALYLCGDAEHQGLMNCPTLVEADAQAIDMARRNRSRLTLLAVKRALEDLSFTEGRSSLILLSPGFLLDNDIQQGEVTTAARDSHTAVYFVDVRGLVTDSGIESASAETTYAGIAIDPSTNNRVEFEELTLESAGAETLAEDTGGFTVKGTNDLASGARRIADESRVFYLLGFYPTPGKSTKDWHKLKIEVKKPGLKVRSRKGYTLRSILEEDTKAKKVEKVEKSDKGDKKKPPKVEPSLVVAAALESAHVSSAIPLRAMTYILEPDPSGATHVLVGVELNTAKLAYQPKGDQRVAHVEASVATLHRDSGRGFIHDDSLDLTLGSGDAPTWRSFVREFELPAGVSQVRVVVRDIGTGALGSLIQRFEVPQPGTLRLATPILTDQIEPAKDGKSHPTASLAVHRTFLPLGGLYCQFEVLGASKDPATGLRRVAAGLELQTAEGHIINKVDPSLIAPDADGRVVRLVGMPLEGMAEGSYDLVLQVQDQVSGSHFEEREPFSLSRTPEP